MIHAAQGLFKCIGSTINGHLFAAFHIHAAQKETGQQTAILVENEPWANLHQPGEDLGKTSRTGIKAECRTPEIQHAMALPNPMGRRPLEVLTWGHGS